MGVLASVALWYAEGGVTGLRPSVSLGIVLARVFGSTCGSESGLSVDVSELLCVPGAISHGFP